MHTFDALRRLELRQASQPLSGGLSVHEIRDAVVHRARKSLQWYTHAGVRVE